MAGDGDGGARRPEDREDAEHARHGAALGFRSPNWRLRLPAAMATSLACVASLASLACGLPPPPRCLGASVGQLPSAPPSYIHAGRRARAIHPAPEAGQAAARLAEHDDHAGLAGTGSRRREARSQERPDHHGEAWCEGAWRKGPGAMGPGAERPSAEIQARSPQRGLVRRGPAAAQRAGRPERPGPLCRGPEDL